MESRIHASHVRIAPRKARVVMELVKGKTAGEALEMLKFLNKAAAKPISKIIESAVENARRKDPTLNVDDLVVKKGYVDQGPAMKRRRPRARGYATLIKKYFSHIDIVLSDE
jgi:large subunit ribosomal protein L22